MHFLYLVSLKWDEMRSQRWKQVVVGTKSHLHLPCLSLHWHSSVKILLLHEVTPRGYDYYPASLIWGLRWDPEACPILLVTLSQLVPVSLPLPSILIRHLSPGAQVVATVACGADTSARDIGNLEDWSLEEPTANQLHRTHEMGLHPCPFLEVPPLSWT